MAKTAAQDFCDRYSGSSSSIDKFIITNADGLQVLHMADPRAVQAGEKY